MLKQLIQSVREAGKTGAAGIHLGLSFVVATLCAALVMGVWYPSPFRQVAGGQELFILIASVDLVLGPLLTFAVFDRRKPFKELRRDLLIVVALQLVGLGYGLNTVWGARPVYLVFEVDRFRVVRAIDIEDAELKESPYAFKALPKFGPKVIASAPPEKQGDILKSIELAFAGKDISSQPKTWRAYDTAKLSVLKRAKPLVGLRKLNPTHAPEIEAVCRRIGLPAERLGYLPLQARQSDWVVLIDNQTADIKGYLPFGGF